MSYCVTTAGGSTEAVIDDNCGMKKFLSIANALAKERRIKFIAKEDYSDTIDWFFKYRGQNLTLHYSIYNGVSICNTSGRGNEAVTELASMLEQKFY